MAEYKDRTHVHDVKWSRPLPDGSGWRAMKRSLVSAARAFKEHLCERDLAFVVDGERPRIEVVRIWPDNFVHLVGIASRAEPWYRDGQRVFCSNTRAQGWKASIGAAELFEKFVSGAIRREDLFPRTSAFVDAKLGVWERLAARGPQWDVAVEAKSGETLFSVGAGGYLGAGAVRSGRVIKTCLALSGRELGERMVAGSLADVSAVLERPFGEDSFYPVFANGRLDDIALAQAGERARRGLGEVGAGCGDELLFPERAWKAKLLEIASEQDGDVRAFSLAGERWELRLSADGRTVEAGIGSRALYAAEAGIAEEALALCVERIVEGERPWTLLRIDELERM